MKAPKTPLVVESAPYTQPGANEIVIENHAVAINPIDWMKVEVGNMLFSWIKCPFVLGSDVAGDVMQIGSAVTGHKVGDRVLGHANGIDQKHNKSSEGAFQTYTIVESQMASSIPDALSYESAAVIPLGVSTAACGLFQEDQLALQYPTTHPKSTGKTLLVWGGATSVGCNAIQLAVAAGYEVITTASPKNFDYVKKLGASHAFDYRSKTIIDDLIHAFKGKTTVGALTMGSGAAEACMDVLDKCTGDKFISMATYPLPDPRPKHFVVPLTIYAFISFSISSWVKSRLRGIRTNFIFGSTLAHNDVGRAIYVDFLPQALAQGTYIAAPDPYVVGKGLECIQTGFEVQQKGVSGKKVVVSL